MSDGKLDRREFLERAALLGAAAIGAGSLLSACDPPEADSGNGADAPDAGDDTAGDFSCNDDDALAGLSDDDIARREGHEYVDDSPKEGEYCHNCLHWEDPEAGQNCGGCAMIPGPFHPDGWCNIWAPAA